MNSPVSNIIRHGDCLTILPQLAAGSADFILTDPPYIARYHSRDGRTIANEDNDLWITLALHQKPAASKPAVRPLAAD